MKRPPIEEPTETTEHSPWRRLIVLGIMVVALIATLIVGTVSVPGSKVTPDLALDLEGGTQIVLTPVTSDGREISDSDISQAIEIIRQRVDASGVSETEISSQGGQNIVVGIPGNPSQATLDLVRKSAVLRLRPVIDYVDNALPARNMTVLAPQTAQPAELDQDTIDTATARADVDGDGEVSDQPRTDPANESDDAWITEQILYEAQLLNCADPQARIDATDDSPEEPIVACDPESGLAYILGPAELEGSHIANATSNPATNEMGQPIGGWAVSLSFTGEGGDLFYETTSRLASYGYQTTKNLFAIVLDGQVISVAGLQAPISGGQAQITGNFTPDMATSLANQLSFGSLPLTFEVQSEEQISATLGSEQLRNSLIAGAIGMVLVVLYLLWQYHGLGVIAVASIFLTTGLSYLLICLLSWTMGYRLSLAGVVGLIISIGISADSFIVYFERIRDEIRDGRRLKDAVEHGWARARQTIVISDIVNLVAAVVLYLLAVGGVRGFAFTLGLTTVIDLLIVFFFTYPVMRLLVRTSFFGGGHRWSGMSEESLGVTPTYRGRGRTSDELIGSSAKRKKARKSGGVLVEERPADLPDVADDDEELASPPPEHSTMTIAERRAAERRAKREAEKAAAQEDN